MTFELARQKIVVIGGKEELDHIIAEAGADEEADLVIWIREWKGNVSKLKQLLLQIAAEVVTQQLNGHRHIRHSGARPFE
jgi:hypothetical protein